jgi:Bax protein
MLKKIFLSLIALLSLLFAYYFTTNKSEEPLSSKRGNLSQTVSQIKERQELELAIKKIYEEAGKELSIKVQKIIGDAKEDMDFILALKPSQVIAINQQVSIREKSKVKKSTNKLKYMPLPNFRKYPAGKERKEIFFKYFFYLVESRNQQILKMRNRVILWRKNLKNISSKQKRTVQQLAKKYKVNDFNIQEYSSWNRLLARLDIIPASLALAQGAKESLWGTSRFARYGYNYYGQRCFSQGCGIVPKERGGRRFEVKTFSSPKQGINSYIHNLNTHFAYNSLRKIRRRQRAKGDKITGLALVNSLGKYSERGSAYIKDLKALIRYNKLAQYDVH